jgi:hypothetical protein
MGHFRDPQDNRLHYYAIMHRFSGPVFLKPEPMSYSELLKDTQSVLTEGLCGDSIISL